MSDTIEAIAWLRVGLLFCSLDWRSRIEARIAELSCQGSDTGGVAVPPNPVPAVRSDSRSGPEGGSVNTGSSPACEPPQSIAAPHAADAGLTHSPPAASGCAARDVPSGVSWAFREHRSLAEIDDWRSRRRALRLAGHEVKQFDGAVYVDGVRSDDAGLYPSDGDEDTRL